MPDVWELNVQFCEAHGGNVIAAQIMLEENQRAEVLRQLPVFPSNPENS